MINFEIIGKPQGKARARTYYNAKLNRIMTFTPDKTVNYENWIKLNFFNNYPNHIIIEKPLQVKIICYFKKNKSNKMIEPIIKPDLDNIAKIILDSLNNVAYKDDKQVINLNIIKKWGDIDKVNIQIQPMED